MPLRNSTDDRGNINLSERAKKKTRIVFSVHKRVGKELTKKKKVYFQESKKNPFFLACWK